MVDAQEVTLGEGTRAKRAMKGKCEKCGTGMYRIMGKK